MGRVITVRRIWCPIRLRRNLPYRPFGKCSGSATLLSVICNPCAQGWKGIMAEASLARKFETWSVPGHSVRIEYSRAALEEIRTAAVDGYHRAPHGGVETGGILFGTHQKRAVRITAGRPIACEFAKGPSFLLSEREEAALADTLKDWCGDPELAKLEPVGWYRAHNRSEILLCDTDLSFFNRFFPQDWQVGLIVRPARLAPTRAGFFFREPGGSIRTEGSYGEFVLAPFQVTLQLDAQPAVAEAPLAVSEPPRAATCELWPLAEKAQVPEPLKPEPCPATELEPRMAGASGDFAPRPRPKWLWPGIAAMFAMGANKRALRGMAAVASVTADTASAGGYVWKDPGDSIMIQVSLDLVERLGAAVQEGLGTGPRGNEIGGILLGRTLPDFGRAVLIEDFELAPCEHLRGPSYTLSPKDRRLLGTRLAHRRARQVVGYFRSHTRPGMYLDQEDFAVFSHYFPDPSQVFLLVSPATEGPAIGGFFFWEDGDVNRRSTYREFPFDCARLATGDFPLAGGQPAAAPRPRPAPVLVPRPLAPKPEARARHRLPPLPWVAVPVIAVLFFIAGFFVSENHRPAREAAAAKASVPVEPLLPEPVPQAAVSPQVAVGTPAPPAAQEAAAPQSEPMAQAPAAEPKPIAKPKPKPAKKPLRKVVAPPPVTVARMPFREVEPPPALALPIDRLEARLPAVLPSPVNAAPPPEAGVSYETPRPGVFRRALHKIEGTGEVDSAAFVPPSPIRKVAPIKPADAGAETRPVDVKVFIDDSGNVSRALALTKGNRLATLAALSAARQWQFTPARKHDKPVPSEMVLHFR